MSRVLNILTVSSHVVHGNVGNDAIQFPLNLRDWNVDAINTTNLSCHPGGSNMKKFTKVPVTMEEIATVYRGIVNNRLDYNALLIGYVGSYEILEYVWTEIVPRFKDQFIVVDPIMGDNDRIYVDERIVEGFQTLLKVLDSHIDLITPNQFEMELLTGIKITNFQDLNNAIGVFQRTYPKIKNLVITSLVIDGNMYCVGVEIEKNRGIFYVKVREIDAVFSGSGDLFLSILTDEFYRSKDLVHSLNNTVYVMEKVLECTHASTPSNFSLNGKKYIPNLNIVSCKGILLLETTSSENVAYL